MTRSIALLRSALAGGAILGALWALPTASFAQQVVTLNGPSATATCTASAATIGTNSITVTCAANPTTTGGGGGPVTTATISLGAASGAINGTTGGTATMAVNCSGECTNVGVSLGASGVTGATVAPATMLFAAPNPAAQQATITVPAATGAGTGTVTLTVTAAGSATGTTPAVSGTLTSNFTVNAVTANGGSIEFAVPFTAAQTNFNTGSPAFYIYAYRPSGTDAVSAQIVCTPDQGYAPTFTPSTVSWAAGVTGLVAVQVRPGNLPSGVVSATVTCSMQNVTGGAATNANSSYTVTVGGGSAGGSANCTTTATNNVDMTLNTVDTRAYISGLSSTQTLAVKFLPTRNNGAAGTQQSVNMVASWPLPGYPVPLGATIQVSECPGDFVTTPPTANPGTCGFYTPAQPATISTGTTAVTPSWYCKLDPTKAYYFNVKLQDTTGASTCPGSCGFMVDTSYN